MGRLPVCTQHAVCVCVCVCVLKVKLFLSIGLIWRRDWDGKSALIVCVCVLNVMKEEITERVIGRLTGLVIDALKETCRNSTWRMQ